MISETHWKISKPVFPVSQIKPLHSQETSVPAPSLSVEALNEKVLLHINYTALNNINYTTDIILEIMLDLKTLTMNYTKYFWMKEANYVHNETELTSFLNAYWKYWNIFSTSRWECLLLHTTANTGLVSFYWTKLMGLWCKMTIWGI